MQEIQKLVRSLGVHATYKGYHFLVYALYLTQANSDRLLYITKDLYPQVAQRFNSNSQCVERNIRTVINYCWKADNRELLQGISPYPLSYRPSASEFLDILYWHLTEQMSAQNPQSH